MEQAESTRTTESTQSSELKTWQLALIGAGLLAAFAGSILEGVAYAMGAAFGAGVIYYVVIRVAKALYQRFDALQLGVIPYSAYVKLSLAAGVLSIPSAFVLQSQGNGAFLLFYLLFGLAALVVYGIILPGVQKLR